MAHFQRVYAEDREAMAASLAQGRADLAAADAAGDAAARLDLLGRVGECERLLGRLDAAIPHLCDALALARARDNARLEVVNLIRLATALQYRDEHAEADALFRECLALIERTGEREREDFAHQHHGKCLAEMGRYDDAATQFARALALRRTRGDAALIASSEAALAAVRALMAG